MITISYLLNIGPARPGGSLEGHSGTSKISKARTAKDYWYPGKSRFSERGIMIGISSLTVTSLQISTSIPS